MPYTKAQRKQHITELQTYLYAISQFDDTIPQIIPDGVYGQETAAAVRAFQHKYSLPETGNTDPATWNKIVSIYRSYLHAEPMPYNVFPSASYVVKSGENGTLIYVIQAMLSSLGESYDNMPELVVCGEYNPETAGAIKNFQRRMGLPQNGSVDSGTWNMLVHCCEHVSNTMLKHRGK